MPGPEDYAIESLAESLMGGTAEATTEKFYTGKHMSVDMTNFRREESLEWTTGSTFPRHKASRTKWEEKGLQVLREAPSK